MEILKKLSLILILVVGATFLISCNKNNNNLNEKLAEKEINKLETKDLSIYELIKIQYKIMVSCQKILNCHQRILMEFLGQMGQWMEFIYIILLEMKKT